MSASPRIGVIGLGHMGRPIARNLVESGYAVRGYDIASVAMAAAAAEGVEPAGAPAAIAQTCDLVLLMVWDDDALRNAVFGRDGLLAAERLPGCSIDLSTTSVAAARDVGAAFAARGTAFLDGAVIGGGVAAVKARQSPLVVGGARDAYDRCRTVLSTLGSCDYVGPLGSAKAVKLINNFLVGIVTAANAEALSLGAAMGLDSAALVRALQDGPGASHVLASYMGRYVREGRYGEGLIGHRLMAKDLQLASELAESLGVAAVYPRFGQQMYLAFGRMLGADAQFPSAFDYFRRTFDGGTRAAEAPVAEASH